MYTFGRVVGRFLFINFTLRLFQNLKQHVHLIVNFIFL